MTSQDFGAKRMRREPAASYLQRVSEVREIFSACSRCSDASALPIC